MAASGPLLFRLGNKLYKVAFPIYRPLYAAYKAYDDRAERRLLARLLQPGSVVVDAGANIGIYSRFVSKCVGPRGLVHSFEPSPDNFVRLQAALSESPNVRLNQLALGAKSEASVLYLSDDLNVDHRVYPPADGTRRTLSIQTVALDDYFRPGQRVDFIKMDIQGYELHALRGAQRVIRENPGLKLLLELWPYALRQAGGSWKELVSMLESHGMLIQQFSRQGLVKLELESIVETPEWYLNLFASRAGST